MTTESDVAIVRVGFDSPPRMPGGIARYTHEVTEAMSRLAHPRFDVRTTAVREWLRPVAARAWSMGVRLPFGATIDAANPRSSLHATSVFAPPRRDAPLVVTVHDMVPYSHPHTLTPHGAAWHQRMIRRAVEHADALVVPTHAVAERLIARFDYADESLTGPAYRRTGHRLRDRVLVAGGAASLDRLDDAQALEICDALGVASRPFVLFVGTIEPRKGLAVLIRTVALRSDVDLVVVGARGWGGVQVSQLAEQARLSASRVVALGAVHDVAVAALMQSAVALVVPSEVEGFGLPLIEGMRLGTPVVHSNDEALSEVAGGAGVVANILASDASPAPSLTDCARILNDALDEAIARRATLVASGQRRAADFSWDKTATRILDLHSRIQGNDALE